MMRKSLAGLFPGLALGLFLMASPALVGPAQAQARKPNIVVIMGDDVGMWNLSTYHRGMMGGSTPNIDRIAKEGALFTDSTLSNRARQDGPRSSSGRPPSAPGC
jgi:Sulfatase